MAGQVGIGIENPALQLEEDKVNNGETKQSTDPTAQLDMRCDTEGVEQPNDSHFPQTMINGVHPASSHNDVKPEQNGHEEIGSFETSEKKATNVRCARIAEFCTRVISPLEVVNHPLPESATRLDRLKRSFFCPPFGRVGAFILVLAVFLVWWAVLISITNSKALPGGIIFPMLMLFVCCWCGGYVINLIKLPPLFGMLIMGGLLGNVPGIDVGRRIDPTWSSTARSIALTIILTRAGLGLDPAALKKLSLMVLRLAFCPSIVEVVMDSVAAHFFLAFPWPWAFMLGFVLAVVSPAVIVPSMLGLSDRGYGLNKGIPTLVVAAVSLDAVMAITGFGVMLSVAFSTGNIAWTLVQGPLQIIAGLAAGCLGGVFLWYIPQRSSKHLVLFRSVLLLGGGLVAIFGSKYVGWSGTGPLGCLAIAFVSGLRWRKECGRGQKTPVEEVMAVLWMVFQPLLFGLIGAKVDLTKLHPSTVGLGVAVIAIGLTCRVIVAFSDHAKLGPHPSGTFLYSVVLDSQGNSTGGDRRHCLGYGDRVKRGTGSHQSRKTGPHVCDFSFALILNANGDCGQVLTLAVLAIVLTAPIGSLLIALLGPRLLHKTELGGQNNNSHLDKQADQAVERMENGKVIHIKPSDSLNNK
ncbi:hypothetical protein C0Q70_01143 [Pomacea canaliculata]|uniref:Uncharacterized protein n=1 Tax=Pomacea canaliculata TaxID=400727 RepID=A0A2T7PYQ5_POMCA|nr:hypothetical protein C0Q70_01143 [Pomacea canaliculata]